MSEQMKDILRVVMESQTQGAYTRLRKRKNQNQIEWSNATAPQYQEKIIAAKQQIQKKIFQRVWNKNNLCGCIEKHNLDRAG